MDSVCATDYFNDLKHYEEYENSQISTFTPFHYVFLTYIWLFLATVTKLTWINPHVEAEHVPNKL